MKCSKLVRNVLFFLFHSFCFCWGCVWLLPKTHSFIPLFLPCTVHKLMCDVSERKVNSMGFFVKAGNHFVSDWCLFPGWFWLRVWPKQVDLKAKILSCLMRKDVFNITFRWTPPPPRLRSNRHIAQVFLSLFMFIFSMSWNAMFLVLLTLYSVIHFIINSLPNIIISVLILIEDI